MIMFAGTLFYIRDLLIDNGITIRRDLELCEKYGLPCDSILEQKRVNDMVLDFIDTEIKKVRNKGGEINGKCIG